MALELYNTLERSLVPFEPLDPEQVRVYSCGPTIYDHAHIGNFRTFLVSDLLHRYLEWRGYPVRFVMNLTDVDDRTIERAAGAGVTIAEHTGPYGESFLEGLRTLGMLPADAYPRATAYVGHMVEFVETLVERGHAYVADDGSVYFSIGSFPGYGRLSRVDLDQVKPGARVATDDYEKEDVRDFVLWKAAKGKDEEVGAAWDSPWGRGRPGWHLECSVMSIAELGETLDIHIGGEDLVFPHHEDEIAQSEAATGEPFVRYWMHVKHLRIDDEKMAKSLGNFVLLRDLLERGYEPAAIRHQLLSAHYRAELNFTVDGLEGSGQAVQRLLDFQRRVEQTPVDDEVEPSGTESSSGDGAGPAGATADGADGAEGAGRAGTAGGSDGAGRAGTAGGSDGAGGAGKGGLAALADTALADFRTAMDHDLNSADALAAAFVLVSKANALLDDTPTVSASGRDAVLDALGSMDRVLGLMGLAGEGRAVDADTEAQIEHLIAERNEARASRDFQRADAIRDELAAEGIVLEDTADGTRWKVVRAGPEG